MISPGSSATARRTDLRERHTSVTHPSHIRYTVLQRHARYDTLQRVRRGAAGGTLYLVTEVSLYLVTEVSQRVRRGAAGGT